MGVRGDGVGLGGARRVHHHVTSEVLYFNTSSDGEPTGKQLLPLSEDYSGKSRCISSQTPNDRYTSTTLKEDRDNALISLHLFLYHDENI